ncbi:MAG: hypothetical protein WC712_09760 [Candidatus Brocadiia bacterium]
MVDLSQLLRRLIDVYRDILKTNARTVLITREIISSDTGLLRRVHKFVRQDEMIGKLRECIRIFAAKRLSGSNVESLEDLLFGEMRPPVSRIVEHLVDYSYKLLAGFMEDEPTLQNWYDQTEENQLGYLNAVATSSAPYFAIQSAREQAMSERKVLKYVGYNMTADLPLLAEDTLSAFMKAYPDMELKRHSEDCILGYQEVSGIVLGFYRSVSDYHEKYHSERAIAGRAALHHTTKDYCYFPDIIILNPEDVAIFAERGYEVLLGIITGKLKYRASRRTFSVDDGTSYSNCGETLDSIVQTFLFQGYEREHQALLDGLLEWRIDCRNNPEEGLEKWATLKVIEAIYLNRIYPPKEGGVVGKATDTRYTSLVRNVGQFSSKVLDGITRSPLFRMEKEPAVAKALEDARAHWHERVRLVGSEREQHLCIVMTSCDEDTEAVLRWCDSLLDLDGARGFNPGDILAPV